MEIVNFKLKFEDISATTQKERMAVGLLKFLVRKILFSVYACFIRPSFWTQYYCVQKLGRKRNSNLRHTFLESDLMNKP